MTLGHFSRVRRSVPTFDEIMSLIEDKECVPDLIAQARLTPRQIERCVDHFGSEDKLQQALAANPYLLMAVDGFAFRRTDKIAMALGVEEDDPRRLAALTVMIFREKNDGHCYLTPEQMIYRAREELNMDKETAIRCAVLAKEAGFLVSEGRKLWLTELRDAEYSVARFVERSQASRYDGELDETWLNNTNPSEEQQEAVRMMLESDLSLVTGGAGCGKTTALQGVVAMTDCVLMSFTGKAALRMSEVTGQEARTIHSFLWSVKFAKLAESEEVLSGFRRKLLVVDEASMLSLELASWLFSTASALGCPVALIGDANQLPSIDPGQVFHDLLESGCLPVMRLTRNFRSEDLPGLVVGAERVLAGSAPRTGTGLTILKARTSEEAVEAIIEAIRQAQEKGDSWWAEAPVLTWMRKTRTELNVAIQEIRNPHGKEWEEVWRGGAMKGKTIRKLRVGDPVTHLVNDRSRGLVNGERGVITSVDLAGRVGRGGASIGVRYPSASGKKVAYYDSLKQETDDIELSYAMTTHKAQGSEYNFVYVCLPFASSRCEQALLYTAITRGQQEVRVATSGDALDRIAANSKRGIRQTRLVERLNK